MDTSNNYSSATSADDIAPGFTPEYLKQLRIQKENLLDVELVKMVEDEIQKANGNGKTNCFIYLEASCAWNSLIEHFEKLGYGITVWEYCCLDVNAKRKQMKRIKFDWNA